MRDQRMASLRLIIILSVFVGCWSATLSATLVAVGHPPAQADS